MAATLYERHDSRGFEIAAQGGGITLRWTASGVENETELYVAVLLTAPEFYGGFIRTGIHCNPLGGPIWEVEVQYGPFGLNGTGDPVGPTGLGGEHKPQKNGPGGDEPLGPEFHLNLTFRPFKAVQSLRTLASRKRQNVPATADLPAVVIAPDPIPDFGGAINVNEDGVQGIDLGVPAHEWSITVSVPILTMNYIRDLGQVLGGTNISSFYGFPRDELLYLGCSGGYTQSKQWSLTHRFGYDPYRYDDVSTTVTRGLQVPFVGGNTVLWVKYEKEKTGNNVAPRPNYAYIEQVFPSRTFTLLDIGV